MWKETPVIGGRVGGIQLQIEDGVSGFLVATVAEAASRVVELCENPELADRLGRAGREGVRQRFLITRLLEDWLRLLGETVGTRTGPAL